MEKKREEDKRRFSQEKDKRSKKDHIYEEDEGMKSKPGRFIKPEKKKEEVVEEVPNTRVFNLENNDLGEMTWEQAVKNRKCN